MSRRVTRPDVDEYFLKIASVVAERATCQRHMVGAVAVVNKHILATGYNGAPSGARDCLTLGCMRDELGIPSGTQARNLPRHPCRAECYYSGRSSRRQPGRLHHLLHAYSVRPVCQDAG